MNPLLPPQLTVTPVSSSNEYIFPAEQQGTEDFKVTFQDQKKTLAAKSETTSGAADTERTDVAESKAKIDDDPLKRNGSHDSIKHSDDKVNVASGLQQNLKEVSADLIDESVENEALFAYSGSQLSEKNPDASDLNYDLASVIANGDGSEAETVPANVGSEIEEGFPVTPGTVVSALETVDVRNAAENTMLQFPQIEESLVTDNEKLNPEFQNAKQIDIQNIEVIDLNDNVSSELVDATINLNISENTSLEQQPLNADAAIQILSSEQILPGQAGTATKAGDLSADLPVSGGRSAVSGIAVNATGIELMPAQQSSPSENTNTLLNRVPENEDVKNLATPLLRNVTVSGEKINVDVNAGNTTLQLDVSDKLAHPVKPDSVLTSDDFAWFEKARIKGASVLTEKIQLASESLEKLQAEQSTAMQQASAISQRTGVGFGQVADGVRMQMPLNISFGHAGWSGQLAERAAMMSFQKIQVAEMQLDPPELGSLHVKVSVNSDQQASVTFISPHANVRDALDQTIVRLRELLEQQGLDLVDVNVSDQQEDKNAKEKADAKPGSGDADTVISEEVSPQLQQTISQYGVDFYA